MERINDTDAQNIEYNCEKSPAKVGMSALRTYNLLLKSCEWRYGRSVLSIRKVLGGDWIYDNCINQSFPPQ